MLSFFEKRKKISVTIALVIAIIIFYISSLTFEKYSGTGGFGIKADFYHILIFFLFAFFLLISLLQGKIKKAETIIGIIFSFVYAISDEFHQHFVPNRSMSITDVMYDSFGIIFAATIYLSLIAYRSRKNRLIKLNNK